MSKPSHLYIVIPAAGTAVRFGDDTPKQYALVKGKPVLLHTIASFQQLPHRTTIVVPVDDVHRAIDTIGDAATDISWGSSTCGNHNSIINHQRSTFEKGRTCLSANLLGHEKVHFVQGGQSRHRSIHNGLLALKDLDEPPQPESVVVIHDGARPVVPVKIMDPLIQAAMRHKAAGISRPLVSTVISVNEDGFLEEVLDRDKYLASEMPQAFLYDVITRAYRHCTDADLDRGTECLNLVLKYCGVRAKVIPGPEQLFKVTFQRDLPALEYELDRLDSRHKDGVPRE
ncbi:unnamed protein product [Darwinula stevensoni]|uniref:2-C-methyl-D-erythritol 4-phosphate cytidylyltransferase n=1 Tax=Darwinula stevensoni TaxID=69355 RepID=A0A7R9A9K8_9CRUS|nr:unnamed protein product [Darwinula stevensoni]CAG0897283.1 unnamed protein product [Darwinula stevensoni]